MWEEQKTVLETHEVHETINKTKPKIVEESSPFDFGKYQPKEDENWNAANTLIIGKGKKPGI